MRPHLCQRRRRSDRARRRRRLASVGKLFGSAAVALPWGDALKGTKFESADVEKMRTLFDYLRFCLEQVVKDNELGALVEALEGQYVLPGPGGDPIRNPKVLPTGKNIHALDPQAIPTGAAVASAKVVVDRLIEREKKENNGVYPESIALVLWGTDNIKTYGESLAQVMLMVVCDRPRCARSGEQARAYQFRRTRTPGESTSSSTAPASSATCSSTR